MYHFESKVEWSLFGFKVFVKINDNNDLNKS